MDGAPYVSRTLPRVRELKRLLLTRERAPRLRRTLPRVRELKLTIPINGNMKVYVAPFPGCVN